MCVRFCEFWTCRVLILVISLSLIIVSGILGPLHTLFYALGMRKDLDDYLKNEFQYGLLLIFMLVMFWIIFISNSILLFGCCNKSSILLDTFVVICVFNMIFTFAVAVRYAIHCTVIDKYCFDHSSERKSDDKGAALGLLAADLLYLLACVVIIFIVCSYKLAMR